MAAATMKLNTVEFLLHEAWISMRRNGIITVAAVSNVTAVLIVCGVFLLVAANVDQALGRQASKAVLTVDLVSKAEPAQVKSKILADKRVKDVVFVSKEDNLHDLAVAQGWDLNALRLIPNPLPNCLKVVVVRADDIPDVAKVVRTIKGVADVHYAQQVTLRLLTLIRGAKITGLVLVLVLAVASLGIIGTTIRLTIYARRREIRVMQLVGATNWFIRLPFLIEGGVCGLAGGLLSMVLLMVGYSYLAGEASRSLPFMSIIYGPRPLAVLAILMVLGGILFGIAGSLLATREYLKEV